MRSFSCHVLPTRALVTPPVHMHARQQNNSRCQQLRCRQTAARAQKQHIEQQQQQQQQVPQLHSTSLPACHQQQQQQLRHAQDLSAVLLLNENIKRQLGRPLLQRDQLLQGVELLETADYACLVINSSSSGSSSSNDSRPVQPGYTVLYANRAARDVLLLLLQHDHHHHQQQQQQLLLQTLQVLPPAVAGILQSITQQQQQQQQQQQCVLLQDVSWSAGGCSNPEEQQQQQQHELHIPHLLCVPLLSPNDAPFGLCLLFDSWRWGDESLGLPGWPRVLQGQVPDEGAVQQAADAVRQQADSVRALKTQQGLGNKDPAVVAAVSELQALKQQLATLEGLQAAFAVDRHSTLQELIKAWQDNKQQQHQHG